MEKTPENMVLHVCVLEIGKYRTQQLTLYTILMHLNKALPLTLKYSHEIKLGDFFSFLNIFFSHSAHLEILIFL
jgi:hypothetical protein